MHSERVVRQAGPSAAYLRFALVFLFFSFGGAAVARAQTLSGRPVAKASDLAGSWMRATPGNWMGLEFTRDGQVIVTEDLLYGNPLVGGQRASTFTFNFRVLDGGRLSFAAPNGMTTVFETRAAGDLIELTLPTEQVDLFGIGLVFGGSQQFRRLPSGKSLAQALREEAERLAAERQKRVAAINKLFAGGDLVLTPPQGNAPIITLKLASTPDQRIEGLAIVDDSPERPDFINPIRVHPFRGAIAEGDPVVVTLELARAAEPLNQSHVEGRVTLNAEGPAERPTLTGTADFPARRQSGLRLALKSDAKITAGVQARLEKQRETIRQKLATVAGPLGGRVILTGSKPTAGGAQPQPVELTVERVAGSEAYTARGQLGRAQLNGVGALDLVIDRPVLRLAFQSGEEWRLQVKDDRTTFAGDWRPHQNTDFLSHGTVALTVQRMWTVEQLAAIAKAIERYVATDLRKPIEFAGRVTGLIPGSEARNVPVPLWLRLQSQPDGKVGGQAWFLAQDGGVELEGTAAPNGAFVLRSTRVLEGSDKTFEKNFGAPQTWQFQLDIDPQPKLEGALGMTGPYGRGGPLELAPASEASVAEMRRKLIAALRGGASFVTTRYEGYKPAYFRLKADASGKISGEVVGADFMEGAAAPPGLLAGEIAVDRGHALLKLVFKGAPELRGISFPDAPCTLAAQFDGDTLTLAGWGLQTRLIAATGGRPIAGLVLKPMPVNTPVPETEEERIRLAGLRLGALPEAYIAREQPIKNPQPGDEVLMIVGWNKAARYVQGGYADGRYAFGLAGYAAAAMHAGLLRENELAIVRVTFAPPFTESIAASEQNGLKAYAYNHNPKRPSTVPTFRIERVTTD